jgi:hypothetical protein
MAGQSQADNLCAMCDQPGVNACSGCHSIRYCSPLCQETDWPLHKLICKTYKDFSDTSRPPTFFNVYKRAIYFSEFGDRPRFVWMRYHGPDAQGRVIVDMSCISPNCRDLQHVNELTENMVLRRQLNRCISIAGRAWPLASENMDHAGKENKSLLKIDKELSQWIHGPFIAMGCNGPFLPNGTPNKVPWHDQVYDLEPIDLRHIIDRMRGEYWRSGREFKIYEDGSEEKVQGVRLNCLGDINICRQLPYRPVDVAKSLCSEETDLIAPLADKLGVPLVLRKVPHTLAWRGRHDHGVPCALNQRPGLLDPQKQFDNLRNKLLNEPDMESLWANLDKVSANVGSYVVVRKDGQPLENTFVQGLEIYARIKIRTAISYPNKSGDWTKDILAEVSKADWLEFYEGFKSRGFVVI